MNIYVDSEGKTFSPPLMMEDGGICWNPTPEMLNDAGFILKSEDQVIATSGGQLNQVLKFDCYKVMEALGKEGWSAKCAELKTAGLYDYFMRAPYLSTGDPLFKEIYDALSPEEKEILRRDCKYERI